MLFVHCRYATKEVSHAHTRICLSFGPSFECSFSHAFALSFSPLFPSFSLIFSVPIFVRLPSPDFTHQLSPLRSTTSISPQSERGGDRKSDAFNRNAHLAKDTTGGTIKNFFATENSDRAYLVDPSVRAADASWKAASAAVVFAENAVSQNACQFMDLCTSQPHDKYAAVKQQAQLTLCMVEKETLRSNACQALWEESVAMNSYYEIEASAKSAALQKVAASKAATAEAKRFAQVKRKRVVYEDKRRAKAATKAEIEKERAMSEHQRRKDRQLAINRDFSIETPAGRIIVVQPPPPTTTTSSHTITLHVYIHVCVYVYTHMYIYICESSPTQHVTHVNFVLSPAGTNKP